MKAFVHAFEIDKRYYIYDVNTNRVIEVSKDLYQQLLKGNEIESVEYKELKQKGLLSGNRMSQNYNPINEAIEDIIDTNLDTLLLQVTQNCNFRCEYCMYSGKYDVIRMHSKKEMSKDIMKKVVDFLSEHSFKSPEITIGFYGGEPLVNYELIKETICYSKKVFENKKINYTMTTNASLITNEIADFLVENDFQIQISIDGDANTHNKNRKYVDGRKTFEDVINNLIYIYRKYPKYYSENLAFNAVLDSNITDFQKAVSFFANNELFKHIRPRLSAINMVYKNNVEVGENTYWISTMRKRKMEVLYYYSILSGRTSYNEFEILDKLFGIKKFAMDLEDSYLRIPPRFTHAGICIPGATRIFVNAEGNFFPCEKVDECSNTYKIGDYLNGIDIMKVSRLLEIGKLTEEKCKNCWAIRFCTMCVAKIDIDHFKDEIVNTYCEAVRRQVDKLLKTYVILELYGKL